jgi:hypothetical protein
MEKRVALQLFKQSNQKENPSRSRCVGMDVIYVIVFKKEINPIHP